MHFLNVFLNKLIDPDKKASVMSLTHKVCLKDEPVQQWPEVPHCLAE